MDMSIDRRAFLKTGLSLAGALATRGAAQPPGGFVRYSAFDPRARLDSYRRGVEQMKQWSQQNPNDPRGWAFQAAIHGSTMDGEFFNKCEHASWWFFPWHRAYLYYFERIVRKASGDDQFTLPYWDWNAAGRKSLPEAFRDPKSPLYDGTRDDAVNAGEPLPARETDPGTALAAPFFLGAGPDRGFGGVPWPTRVKGLLENPPHDTVHVLITGNMGDPQTAGLDPIFWLHHADVDRLWDVWLSGGRSNPDDDSWQKNLINGRPQPFVFFDENGDKVAVLTADFVQGGPRLDYHYDNLQGNSAVLLADADLRRRLTQGPRPAPSAPPSDQQKALNDKRATVFGNAPRVEVTANANRVVLGADPVTVQALIVENKRQALTRALELAREDVHSPPAILLHVEDVRATTPPGVVFRVYLNQPTASATTDPDEANYVGSIALFQSSSHGHGAQKGGERPGESFSFDVTRLIQGLRGLGKWDEGKVNVTLVSKGVGGKTRPRGEVTFQRVSLTIERR